MTNPLYDTLFGRHAGADTPFLHLPDGSVLTHDAFLRMAARFAHLLTDRGLQPRDRLAVQVPKSPQALALYAACVQAGIVFLPLNTAYTPSEVEYFVSNSGAKLVVGDPTAPKLADIAHQYGAQHMTLGADGDGSIANAAKSKSETYPTVPRARDDLAAFLYTSGTTGRSKGAMLTQGNLLSNAETLVEHWRFTADDVLLHALPIFHTHGLFTATNTILAAGASMIFLPKFEPDAVIAALPKATAMMGVPTFYTRLLDDPRFDREATRNMRLFVSGSAPLLAEVHRRFEERTGHRILERYGMTETNMNTSNPYDGERRAGTVGFPLPGVELRIVKPDTTEEVPQGEIGVIEVRGPNVFKGYWQMPEKTAEELRKDGWFITGDLGQIDPDGYVVIVGRNKDLIISGGYNIYPKEIEQVLDEQPGVLESAVIGAPHPDFGETVVALLVPDGEGPDVEAIKETLRERLANYKQPRLIETVSELPRNTMGKVQKAALRERYAKTFA
ncbi:malonate--CoA ligase [Roseitranquillus sediminis]|uniref:malonate--CoA ligase n=1 Tax=Roseitranquillus sediminis TaxID=2809051 RepID=UPI001D0C62E4|nr:malonyl-CoA synthase [Roseitranquillus sediminis]MBM9593232.1 malonyl-CoA synthase [Roseitranquillus sediminis]